MSFAQKKTSAVIFIISFLILRERNFTIEKLLV